MTDDNIVKDTARHPEREALGPMRGGIRAAAKKVARKVAKKAGQKKATKKTTTAAGKTVKRSTRSAKGSDKTAPANVVAPASKDPVTRTSAVTAGTAPAGAATAASGTPRASESAADTPATPSFEPGPSIETLRPPAPVHPGAAMDSMQEQAGGLGGILALWGPLIIVGFLVLVFRGGTERDSSVTAAAVAANPATMDVATEAGPERQADGTADSATGVLPPERMAGSPGAAQGAAEAFDGGFAMRTSMAGPPPAFAARRPGAGMPAFASGRLYPSPPGPYRDPRFRSLPTGESWSADGAGEWLWSAEGPASRRREDGSGAPVQWVRCEAPYFWCPAPGSPAW